MDRGKTRYNASLLENATLAALSAHRKVCATLAAERERWALWAPVAIGCGIACYFALPVEPAFPELLTLLGIAMIGTAIAEYFRWGRVAALGLIAVLILAGATLITFRSGDVAAPRIDGSVTLSGLNGTVTSVESFASGVRVRLDELTASNSWQLQDGLPRSVRIKLHRDDPPPLVGQRISLTARLSEAPRPSMPEAYDFARAAWFQGLGGVGFAFTHWQDAGRAEHLDFGIWRDIGFRIARTRHRISQELRETLPGESGAVAAALLAGDRAPVSEDVLADLRQSGLAHLLAISGLHVGMVALIVFVTLRTLLAWNSRWTRERPIKKWAAVGALLATFGYLLLAGASVPTQRAFLMTGVVLVAVMLDRQAISMRLVAIAAAVVMILQPESVVGASFQMSFAAVIALVAFYEAAPASIMRRDGSASGNRLSRLFWYAGAVSLTTLIAGTATAPFALHHFGQIAHYSVLANVVAVPIVTFWVMPLGLLALILMPLGLHDLPLQLCGLGIESVLWIAQFVSELPGAVGRFPALTDWGFVSVVIGGLWMSIWRLRWRYLGFLAILIGLLSPMTREPPVLILHENRTQAAILWGEGYWVTSLRREVFSMDVWQQRTGLPILGDFNDLSEERNAPILCDPLGCLVTLNHPDGPEHGPIRLALASDPRALRDDCRLADVTHAPVQPHPALCQDRVVVGPADLSVHGAHAIGFGPDGVIVERVEDGRSGRPWSQMSANSTAQ